MTDQTSEYTRLMRLLISVVFAINTFISPVENVFADSFSDKLSTQSIFKPLENFEKKDIAMLEYALVTNLRSGKWDASALDRDVEEKIPGYELKFNFSKAAKDDAGKLIIIPAVCNEAEYVCALKLSQEGKGKYEVTILTAREARGVDLPKEAYRMGIAARAEAKAISSALASEAKHDRKIRNAIKEGRFISLTYDRNASGNKHFYEPLLFVYLFLEQVSPQLGIDLKSLVSKGQLMMITGQTPEEKLDEPHAGGKGIYLPEEEIYLSPEVIIHEVYAKAGFTHEECGSFETMFTRFVADLTAGTLEPISDISLGLPASKGERRALYCGANARVIELPEGIEADAAKNAAFIDLIRVIDRRDYSAADKTERLQNFLASAPVGIFKTSVEGELLEGNPKMVKMLGYATFDEIQRHVGTKGMSALFYDPFDWKRMLTAVSSEEEWKTFELQLLKKDGSLVYVEMIIRGSPQPTGGSTRYVEGFFQDISARKKAEAALSKSEEKFRRMFEQSPIGIAFCGANGDVMECNDAYRAIFGLNYPDAVVKENLFTFPAWKKENTEIVMRGEPVRFMMETDVDAAASTGGVVRTTRHGKVFLDCVVTPLGKPSGGPPAAFLFQVRDMTDIVAKQKELDDAYQRLKAQTAQLVEIQQQAAIAESTATIAHEINNPLTVILALLDQAEETIKRLRAGAEIDQQAFGELIEEMRVQCERAAEIVSVQLGYARPVSGMKPCSIRDLIRDMGIQQTPRMVQRSITCRFEAGEDPLVVVGDKSRLLRVMLNLVNNAVEAMATTDKKELTVGAERIASPGGGEVVRIYVRDTGCGMEGTLDDKLHRYETKGKDGFGTGVGLPVVKQVVEEHAGKLRAESTVGKGTDFYIEIPAISYAQELEPFIKKAQDNIAVDGTRKTSSKGVKPVDVLKNTLQSMETSDRHRSHTVALNILAQQTEDFYTEGDEAVIQLAIYSILAMDPAEVQVDWSRRNGLVVLTFKMNELDLKGEDFSVIKAPNGEECQKALLWKDAESTGLAVAHRAISLVGGRVAIEDHGKGNKPSISILIPYKRENRTGPVTAAEKGAAGVKPKEIRKSPEKINPQGANIIVAEDEPVIWEVYQVLFERAGYNVWIAVNGEEALKTIECLSSEGIKIDAGLFDVSMPLPKENTSPVRDGIVLVRQLREKGYQFPVLLASGHAAGEGGISEIQKEGLISGVLTKPVALPTVLSKIKAAIAENLPRRQKTEEIETRSTEKTALVYGPAFELGVKKLKTLGFKGTIIHAKDEEELRGHLISEVRIDMILNTTGESIEELIKKILSGADKAFVLIDDMKDNNILQNKLLQVCA